MSILFVGNIRFRTEECCNCGMPFAMTEDFHDRRRNDHELFYCPYGHEQYYSGKSNEEKLKERLAQEQARSMKAENKAGKISRSYSKMRKRIANGVCPCCNRTFQNLLSHMKTEHPEFADSKVLKTLRLMFGLNQQTMAEEAGINTANVSCFENGKPIPDHARKAIEFWINNHAA